MTADGVATRTPKRILVVEDDVDIRMSLTEILEWEGFEVSAASNGEEGLVALAKGPLPHLILLDLMMPVKNGIEFRRDQLAKPEWALVPVVVMSADGNIEEKMGAMSISAYLKKPVDLDEIIGTVNRLIA